MPLVLALNAVIFWIPRQIWKILEGGVIKSFTEAEIKSVMIAANAKKAQYVNKVPNKKLYNFD